MTQMYGKWPLIITILGLLSGLLVAQEKTGVPILLQTESEAQKEARQIQFSAVFADETLTWVEEQKDADIIIALQDDDEVLITIRQNALLHLSPIFEAAPPVFVPNDDDVAAITALLWQLTQGECDVAEEETALDLIEPDIRVVYEGNCQLIAGLTPDELDHDRLLEAGHRFEKALSLRAAKSNRVWLVHEAGDVFFTRELISLEILNPQATDSEKAFWYAKRAQFYALDFDYQAALRDLDKAMALDDDNPLYPTLKGEVYLLLYEWNNAHDAFEAALMLNPDYAPAYFQRGILLSTMTETESANADFSHYLELEPRGVYAELARQYRGEG